MTEHSGHHDPNEVVDALSAYWDSHADNDAAAEVGAAEGWVAVVDRLHASDTTPALLPEQRQAIWQEIMATQAMGPGPQSQATHRPLEVNGSAPELPRPHPTGILRWSRLRARPGWVVGQLATAALLLLTLVGSFLAFGLGRPERQDDALGLVPAISGTPAAPEAVVTEALLDAATEGMPSGHALVVVDRWQLQPSSRPLTLSQEGMVLITVASGQITAAVAGTEHRLAAGDTFAPNEQEIALLAAGPEDAVAYVVYIIPEWTNPGLPMSRGTTTSDPLAHSVDYLISTSADALPGGSARLVLERLTLPPGSTLPPQEVRPLAWIGIGEGALGLTLEGERLPLRWTSGTERTFRFGQYLPSLAPGTVMAMRNVGDEPLVLYRLTLIPSEATPQPP